MRPIWKGAITFGLVGIPIKLFSATEDRSVGFNLLHERDGERIHYKRVCDKGHEVDWDDIVRGYPVSKQDYVVFTNEELDALAIDSTKEVDVQTFVPLDQIDPMYFDRT